MIAVMLSLLSAAPPVRGPVRAEVDLAYASDSPRQRLDVFSPPARAGTGFPVVVFLHGGTWMGGDKNFFGINRNGGRMLARNGFVAVMANYRLSPEVRHPDHAKDVARAVAWVRANIARYGGDPSRLVLLGHSAGGHLAALVASDPCYLGEADRKAIKGVVSLSGVYRIPDPSEYARWASVILLYWRDFSPGVMKVAGPAMSAASWALNPFWLAFGRSDATRKAASPLTHARKGLPPFLLLYSRHEPPGLAEMAVEFHKALVRCGVAATATRFDGCNHQSIIERLHREKTPVSEAVLAFLDRATRCAP
ncbi:MAG: alpha/beta hydrolase [Gemmataceae bacterium]|nr:alpha/beta hydrolase [Gemmataceae bacterium]